MGITIRPAQPNDAKAAVPLIYSSGPDAFDYVFKRQKTSAEDFLTYAFIHGAGEFGYKNHVVAVTDDGKVVGAGAGFSGKTTLKFTIAAARQIIGFYGLFNGLNTIRRGIMIERIIKPPTKTLFVIAHMGVAPEFRSRGIGRKLVNHIMETGRNAGFAHFGLDVAVTNPRAQALYERIGFTVTKEISSTLTNDYGKVVDHKRMVLRI